MKDKLFIAVVNKHTFKKVLPVQSVIYWPRKMHNMNNDVRQLPLSKCVYLMIHLLIFLCHLNNKSLCFMEHDPVKLHACSFHFHFTVNFHNS